MFNSAIAVLIGASAVPLPPQRPSVTCNIVPGLSQLALRSRLKFVIFGETHGTAEIPSFVEDVVCELSETRGVTVALEWSERVTPDIQKFMQSSGSPADRSALLRSSLWSRSLADGRSSRAMLQLLERLRELRTRGRKIVVVAVQPAGPFNSVSQDYYEVAFANNLVRAAVDYPDNLVVGLLGSRHALKSSEPGSFRSAIEHLPATDVFSLQFRHQGGFAWNCQTDGCGPHRTGRPAILGRGMTLTPGDRSFDGFFSVGRKTEASEPAL